ncbi:MAG TPA: tyrosine-type recombinase/integrase [Pirellulales bacterium]|nr:tyrosine-type recombinase/integrase [Pirellulales bacterium]
MPKTTVQKPEKPYPKFPLTAHPNGQWCKKIRGQLTYFGRWAEDPEGQAALNLYLEQRDDLHAGRKPRTTVADNQTFGHALNCFLSAKKLAEQAGEIRPRTYKDFEKSCHKLAASIGRNRALDSIDVHDLEKLRADLAKGERGRVSPKALMNELTRARMVFLYANEYLLERPIKYRKVLRAPSRKIMRQVANEMRPRMFEAEEIRTMLDKAGLQLKAMILLGVNAGFGNSDCGTLPIEQVDLERGWHNYWRPKTHNPRRAALWPETVDALRAVVKGRKAGHVFITREGQPWSKDETGHNAISAEFRKLLQELGIYRKYITTFCSLRRTFETIGATAGEQVAVDHIMGHIAPADDMAAVYRQKMFDQPLLKVSRHVRDWLFDNVKIS